jgi:4-amino-4-deoxy-L-arabinose transferase-like glycosyltransferase
MLLHFWMQAFGSSESAVHALSVVLGLASIPLAMWAGWSLFGRRAGFLASTLSAFNAFLTTYAAEARMYELVALLGVVCIASFLHAFVFSRRRHALLFTATLALMLYTEPWCLLFAVGCGVALVVVFLRNEDRATVARDGALSFAVAAVLFLPWLPTLLHQAASATAPWHYAPLLNSNFPRQLLGTDRVDALFAIAVTIGCVPLLSRRRRDSRDATAVLVLVLVVVVAVLLALLASVWVPAWTTRYLAPLVAPLLLLIAFSCARSGIVGLAIVLISCAFLANAYSFIAPYKSDMSDISGELASRLAPGDVVLVAMPDQAPLAWYYLDGGLRFATTLGPDPHPQYMNWADAYGRLRRAHPSTLIAGLLASLSPGQHLLYIRPLTEGARAWTSDWAMLVRRRAAQWGSLLARSPELVAVPGAWAPHNYRGSCCIASSAVLYVRR